MNLALVFLISKVQGEARDVLELDLLKRANGWLRRKQAGVHDSLLLVGENFQSEEEFKDFVIPYGLSDADLAVIPESYDEVRGELVEAIVEPWLYENHPAAIGFVEWPKYCDSGTYPINGWWWSGVEAHQIKGETGHGAVLRRKERRCCEGRANHLRASAHHAGRADQDEWAVATAEHA